MARLILPPEPNLHPLGIEQAYPRADDEETASSKSRDSGRGGVGSATRISRFGPAPDAFTIPGIDDAGDAEPRGLEAGAAGGPPDAFDTACNLLNINPYRYSIWIRAFGRLRVHVVSEEIEEGDWPYPKVISLLRFLLMHPGGASIDLVTEAIWPDLPERRARQSFSVALHHLRRTLEPNAKRHHRSKLITYKGQHVRLDHRQVLFDRNLFENLWSKYQTTPSSESELRHALLDAAIGLHTGPLFSDELYCQWCSSERERISSIYNMARHILADKAYQRGDLESCLINSQAVLQMDPLNESAHLLLMKVYRDMGNRTKAIAHYHEINKLLREELGVSPSEPLRQILTELLQD